MDNLIKWDKELLLYLNQLGSPTWDGFWYWISEPQLWIPLYVLFFILLYKYFGWRNAFLIIGISLLMILVTDQMANVFKDSFQRIRPCKDEDLKDIIKTPAGCSGRFGFFSAHAANHFAFALYYGNVFRKKIKWLMPVLLVWAALIAYSRVYLGVHFPLDILCGTVIGILVGILFFLVLKKVKRSYPDRFSLHRKN